MPSFIVKINRADTTGTSARGGVQGPSWRWWVWWALAGAAAIRHARFG